MKTNVYILSLGCPRNLVDSEVLAGIIKDNNYNLTDDITKANVAILSTCVFIKEAKEESISYIFDLVKLKKEKVIDKIIITGCFTQRYPDELKNEIPEIDAIIGFDYYPLIHKAIAKVTKGEKVYWLKDESTFLYDYSMPRIRTTPKHYAYLKISEGCNHACSFCIIPTIKGPLRSRNIESLKKEAKSLIKSGVKEIILIGQDTTTYGMDIYKKPILDELLNELAKTTGLKWLRLLYTHPALFNKKIIDSYLKNKNICRYVDLPLQHISDNILKLMRRPMRQINIIKLIKRVRSQIEDVALRTSFIVGFPHETKKDFKELSDFISEIRFERLGLFKYSQEEGTSAYNLKKQVDDKTKESRYSKLMLLQQDISREINASFIGKVIKVIVDKRQEDDKNIFIGRSQYDAPEVDGCVFIDTKKSNKVKLSPGDIIEVEITDNYEYDLVGVPHEN
jgi:ribosomal protein S12 methylthiotransferase